MSRLFGGRVYLLDARRRRKPGQVTLIVQLDAPHKRFLRSPLRSVIGALAPFFRDVERRARRSRGRALARRSMPSTALVSKSRILAEQGRYALYLIG